MVFDRVEEFVKKFFFHNNQKVLEEIFGFIQMFFQELKAGKVKIVVSPMQYQFFFYTVLFDMLVEEHKIVQDTQILESILHFLGREDQMKVLSNLLLLFNEISLDKAIEGLDLGFSYNIERGIQVNFLILLQKSIELFASLEKAFLQEFLITYLNNQNSIALILVLSLVNKRKFELPSPQHLEQYLNFDSATFEVPFFEREFQEVLDKCEYYLTDHVEEISQINIGSLDLKLNEIVQMFANK